MWSGAVVDIPNGWSLCDGSNGTPDLRNRFIIGAGSTHSPGATGGAITHNHDGDCDDNYDQLDEGYEVEAGSYYDFYSDYTQGHGHSLVIQAGGVLPPYYALCFIMKR